MTTHGTLLLLLLSALACPVWAAEPAPEPVADATAPAEPEPDAQANTDGAAAPDDETPGTMAANDTFVPTVEISEDLSVSFPADI